MAPSDPSGTAFLEPVAPMGIYQTLYAFQGAFGSSMGEPGTHPWSQGFPLTEALPGGPPLPDTLRVTSGDRRYPKAWGLPALRQAIAASYRDAYGAPVSPENVMVFAGGRPAILAVLLFLQPDVTVRVASTEYTPYWDMLERLGRRYELVESRAENGFCPALAGYLPEGHGRVLALLSNPCNPTGVTRSADDLRELARAAERPDTAVLVDEAYELFQEPPASALAHVRSLDDSNLFVVGAATKGLQSPGLRIGWVVSSRQNVETLGNFSSFGMGGVSHLAQRYAVELLERGRLEQARRAVPAYYAAQRARYGEAFERLGLELFTGLGGFYHWCRLPDGMTAATLNQRLFRHGAAILEGPDCDMARRGGSSPLARFFRFSFGPLRPDSLEGDVAILRDALGLG